jgi:hypothetical protein
VGWKLCLGCHRVARCNIATSTFAISSSPFAHPRLWGAHGHADRLRPNGARHHVTPRDSERWQHTHPVARLRPDKDSGPAAQMPCAESWASQRRGCYGAAGHHVADSMSPHPQGQSVGRQQRWRPNLFFGRSNAGAIRSNWLCVYTDVTANQRKAPPAPLCSL